MTKTWTYQEDEYLERNINLLTYKEIAQTLGISSTAVFKRSKILGLKKNGNVWVATKTQRKFVKENFNKMNVEEMAKELNLSCSKVWRIVLNLEINDSGYKDLYDPQIIIDFKKEIETQKNKIIEGLDNGSIEYADAIDAKEILDNASKEMNDIIKFLEKRS